MKEKTKQNEDIPAVLIIYTGVTFRIWALYRSGMDSFICLSLCWCNLVNVYLNLSYLKKRTCILYCVFVKVLSRGIKWYNSKTFLDIPQRTIRPNTHSSQKFKSKDYLSAILTFSGSQIWRKCDVGPNSWIRTEKYWIMGRGILYSHNFLLAILFSIFEILK